MCAATGHRLPGSFQQELYRRVFFNEPYRKYVRETAAALKAGELDDQLVYRKRNCGAGLTNTGATFHRMCRRPAKPEKWGVQSATLSR